MKKNHDTKLIREKPHNLNSIKQSNNNNYNNNNKKKITSLNTAKQTDKLGNCVLSRCIH